MYLIFPSSGAAWQNSKIAVGFSEGFQSCNPLPAPPHILLEFWCPFVVPGYFCQCASLQQNGRPSGDHLAVACLVTYLCLHLPVG